MSGLRSSDLSSAHPKKSPAPGRLRAERDGTKDLPKSLQSTAILVEFVPETLFRARRPAVPSPEQRRFVTHTIPRRAKINYFSGRGNLRSFLFVFLRNVASLVLGFHQRLAREQRVDLLGQRLVQRLAGLRVVCRRESTARFPCRRGSPAWDIPRLRMPCRPSCSGRARSARPGWPTIRSSCRPGSSRRACGPPTVPWASSSWLRATTTTSFLDLAYASISFWISGNSFRQGPHQVAQKSITTTLPASSALVIVLVLPGPSRTVRVKSGAGLPSFSLRTVLAHGAGPEPRVDRGEPLGRIEGERPILGELGRDRAGGPAELLDREGLAGRFAFGQRLRNRSSARCRRAAWWPGRP